MARSRRKYEGFGYTFHSKLELTVATDLNERGIEFTYETKSFPWEEKFPRAFCKNCGERASYVTRSYTPDFFLSNGIILEVKGNFTSKDRKIALAMKEQHPDVDIRMLFQRDNKIRRNSETRYSDWCESKGILYSIGNVPEEWA